MKKIIFPLLLLIVSGCATVNVAMYDKNAHYPATDPRAIEVFQKKPESRKFIEIGEITIDQAQTMEQVERVFRIKAAEYGGDAIYIYSSTEHSKTYATYPECYFYDGFAYPRGHGYHHYYPRYHNDFRRYYYCYGSDYIETATFLTVVGIAIRYVEK
ncbi:MAG: hypothetical protein COX96_09340 [Candidatus Omnitrophica bacterium CG_4_10_14_0_2_um_filter_44_9]|nr:MAG: hypothetical protein COY78_02740 [Candidatus Omnitrophica bacterium CG_4_10_14_0_8_um_filter_44_12]PIZ83014.1 MAG: hypothetical protein COX96_09340 [Candidatus Omnitrophica bacterium CG_4_10_14_0_2_um_filter_44_9]